MNVPVRSMIGEAVFLALQSQVPLQGTHSELTVLYHIKQVAGKFLEATLFTGHTDLHGLF